jgi:hypothetical protein
MLRAKAVSFKKGETTMRDAVLSSTDKLGMFAGIPIVTEAVNAVNKTGVMRSLMESTLGVDKKAWIPEYAPKTFAQVAKPSADLPVMNGEKTPGKVAIYATCYINYNEPGIGQDLIKILTHNKIPYELVNKEACCGMPKLERVLERRHGNVHGAWRTLHSGVWVLFSRHTKAIGARCRRTSPTGASSARNEFGLRSANDGCARRS